MAKLVAVIAAVSRNKVFGQGNRLPWRIPKDMEHFKTVTMGHTVVMGRGTWESLPPKFRPLPGRENMVITNTPGYEAPGAKIFTSLEQAIDAATTEKVFLIGGYNIWYHGLAMGLVDELLITSVDRYYPTDNETRFAPELLRPFDTWPEFYATDSKNFDHDDPPFRITTWKKAPK